MGYGIPISLFLGKHWIKFVLGFKRKMKIGIISHYYKSENYGGNLQAFALCTALNKMGYRAEQISFERRKDLGKVKKAKFFLSDIKKKLKNAKGGILRNLNKRSRAISSFNLEAVPHSQTVYSSKSIKNCVNEYDAFITGSDQVWHPNAVCDEYLLSFAPSNKIKLSYAASIACKTLSNEVALRYKKSFASFNAISVRENDAVPLIKELYRGDVEWSLDPTLLLDAEDWRTLALPMNVGDKYMFCYFLGNDKKSRELAQEYAVKNGLKIVTLPHLLGIFRDCDKSFGDYRLYSVSPRQLISLIDNSKFVFTDSFHITVFSLILNKEFCAFPRGSQKGMESRISNLLSIFELPDRFCNSEESANLDYINSLMPIDYSKEFEIYKKMKSSSLSYLKKHLENLGEDSKKRIEIIDPINCSGCYACASACPKGCITMKADSEGFLYPVVDEKLCIDCGLCKKVCPISSPIDSEKCENDCTAYAAYSKNDEIRINSSSGGVFTEIADWVIKHGGVVFGAAFDSDFNVKHIFVEKTEELFKLRGSKYVQSSIGNAYKEAENFLKEGRLVLFSGTPCQIGGLYSYLSKEYDNLITQDIICHGTPSPALWSKYLNFIEKQNGAKVKEFSFRNKKNGWKAFSVHICLENNEIITTPHIQDIYMKGFLKDLCLRPSCYSCSFRHKVRASDITIADFWGIENVFPHINADKGVSLVIVNSPKANKLFNELKIEHRSVNSLDVAIAYNVPMLSSPQRPKKREEYISDVLNYGYDGIEQKYFKVSRITKIKNKCKRFLKRLLKG